RQRQGAGDRHGRDLQRQEDGGEIFGREAVHRTAAKVSTATPALLRVATSRSGGARWTRTTRLPSRASSAHFAGPPACTVRRGASRRASASTAGSASG